MKEQQILFSGEMVRAILDGRKTVTRRVVVPQPHEATNFCAIRDGRIMTYEDRPSGRYHILEKPNGYKCPYGRPGDRLWVRETWKIHMVDRDGRASILMRADNDYVPNIIPGPVRHKYTERDQKWRSPRFMPRWASRITLEIASVRAERLQDISTQGAAAEGVEGIEVKGALGQPSSWSWRKPFAELWDALNAKRGYSWDSNPWVYVVEFEKLSS